MILTFQIKMANNLQDKITNWMNCVSIENNSIPTVFNLLDVQFILTKYD